MKRTCVESIVIAFLTMCFAALLPAQVRAVDQDLTYSLSFTDAELDDLLAPIALYPDPLLAQLLPASTYPTELADADSWIRSGVNLSNIDDQNWDDSIKAIARYPDVLHMMADNMDWTANLGEAFLNQPEAVASSIQRLRWQARNMGNLVSSDKQDVDIEGGNIEIIPAQPQYLFVPVYDPMIVYVQRPTRSNPPFITFGPPCGIGEWLVMDFDWSHSHVIYHGWNRPGWVNRSRPYVHVTNVYLNNSRPYITQTWRHDASHGDPARYLASRPSGPNASRYARVGEVRGRTTNQARPTEGLFGPMGNASSYSNRGRESRGVVNQQAAPLVPGASPRPTSSFPTVEERRAIPTPSVGQRPTVPSPSAGERRLMPSPTVSTMPMTPPLHVGSIMSQPSSPRVSTPPASRPSVAFGGYRGVDETKILSQRGQASRQSGSGMRQSPAPVVNQQKNTPIGRGPYGDKPHR